MDPFAEIVTLLAADPPAAADRLDALADRLRWHAARLRAAAAAGPDAPTSTGGMGDRAKMRVVGPTGAVTQETDTGTLP